MAVGLGMLARTGDRGLVAAASRVLDKLSDGPAEATSRLGVSGWGIPEAFSERTEQVREALRHGRFLRITYRALDESLIERTIRPRAPVYYVEVAVLEAWCELRADIRGFRVDRIEACEDVATPEPIG